MERLHLHTEEFVLRVIPSTPALELTQPSMQEVQGLLPGKGGGVKLTRHEADHILPTSGQENMG
jgi:hypothetical protein